MGFPKYVYKSGTGKKVNDAGLYTAESALVGSEEELTALGPGWCSSPVEAAAGATEKPAESKTKKSGEHPVTEYPAEQPHHKRK